MQIRIEQSNVVTCRCECGREGKVSDMVSALYWVYKEALRHGVGCHVDIAVDFTFKTSVEAPHRLGIP